MTHNNTKRWFVVVNPVSGGGKGLGDFPKISHLLRENGIEHDPAFTEHRHHATELTVEAANRGYRKIIVVGGDGTLNEVVNGLFIQKQCAPKEITLAVIAVGTGNDWVRTFGLPRNYTAAIRAIKEGHSFLQDVGRVTYTESSYEQTRYMANVAGLGFDAYVIQIFNHLKFKGYKGKWLYLYSLLRGFFSARPAGAVIELDGKVIFNRLLFSLAVGICRYNGGGIQQLPRAVANDGLLDLTIIRPVHWWHVVFRARRLFNGEIYSIGHVHHAQGKCVTIKSAPSMPLETDGELLGGSPVTISVVPQAICIIVNKEFLQD
ncbi:MAG: diacylglycerol kinase family lipid kinase [Alistipes sp.]|nr:diacylglycerol kinase family lipid kinase [Alistipes sp.]